jgi:hypothetical protein
MSFLGNSSSFMQSSSYGGMQGGMGFGQYNPVMGGGYGGFMNQNMNNG